MLEVADLCVAYGRHEALHDVKLTVDRGEMVVILGANGAGKTTLLKAVGGLVDARDGFSLKLDGQDLADADPHDRVEAGIALVPEGRGVFGDLTVRENLSLGAFAKRARGKESVNRERVLALFPRLRERMNQLVRTMSGGEQQMVAIGRALMTDPVMLLLDEPSLGLSPLLTKELFEALAKIRSQDLGVLLVEQNAVKSLAIAERGYVLGTGRIMGAGKSEALKRDPAVARAYLGEAARHANDTPAFIRKGGGRPVFLTEQSSEGDTMSAIESQAAMAAIERARALVPGLRERAMEANRERRVSEDAVRQLWDAKLWHLLRPKKYGGQELRPDVMYEVAGELARGDGSVAWVYAVMSIHDLFMGYFPEEAQAEYWAKDVISSSSFMPGGKATATRGGYNVTGKWSFCSGIDNSQWMLLGCVFGMLDMQPPMPDVRFVMVPTADCKIIDDWHVFGLRGTGSKSCSVDNVFVPEHRILSLASLSTGTAPGAKVHSSPLYRTPVWAIFPFTISSPAVGMARGALEAFVDQMRVRESVYDQVALAKKAGVQMRLSEAAASIDAAELLYKRSLYDTMEKIFVGEPLSVEHRVRSRRDQGFAIRMCKNASELLFNSQGGKGLHESNQVQRAFRDLEAVQAHIVGGWDMPALNYGSVVLGGGPTDLFY